MAVQAVYTLNIGDERLLTVREAAEKLKCDRHIIYQLMERGILKYMKFGRERRPRYSSLCEMLIKYENQDLLEILGLSTSAKKKEA